MRTMCRTRLPLPCPLSNSRWARSVVALNWLLLFFTLLLFNAGKARAGLTMELHLYRNSGGGFYAFYTPLYTNATLPVAPLGTYIIRSPHQPTNGSVRAFSLTAGGISDLSFADTENFYSDFNSAIYQITNGTWTLQFTNATTTNIYQFTVSAPTVTSNMLPVTISNFPLDSSSILTTETNFSWQGPTSWPASGSGQVYNSAFSLDTSTNFSAAQTNWDVADTLPPDANYQFSLQFLYTNTLFSVSTPTDTLSLQPFGGWDSFNILESGVTVGFSVVASHGIPTRGHTLVADYTFEDNNLFAHDFSGGGNDMSYAYYVGGAPPMIVTNDAVAGTYAGGVGPSGWFTPPESLAPLFAGSFSVSLWLKTTNVIGNNSGDQYSSAGIVSDLGNDYSQSIAPMMQSGRKLGFYTGGDTPSVLHSKADIVTGQYVHVVVTRDQPTGQKSIYINGVLDSAFFASTNLLEDATNGDLTIGYNNGQVFLGEVDEVQFYAGVLSSNEVALLHSHPGTNAADVVQLDFPVARYDFEDTNNPGADTSGHHNDADGSGSTGPQLLDVASTNSVVGAWARQFFGDSYYYFGASDHPALSNALAGDFSVTAWINTTNSINSDFSSAEDGMPVFYAYSETTNGTIPLSITGSKAAFSVYNADGTDTTIHSVTSVNDGQYHFLAVTRTQTNGLMNLYVDGVLEASAAGNAAPILTDGTMFIGGGGFTYTGLIDDVRIYGGALAPADIVELAGNGALTFASALGTTNFVWRTSGDSPWFVETTNTFNGVAALQSGGISDTQTSVISVTITGPGDFSFYWQNPSMNNLDLEFDIDGNSTADIGSFTDWTPAGPFHIGPGQHTLSWTAFANGDTDTNEAAFLGQVAFVPTYLAAHFNFDDTNAFYALDVSSNGNDMNFGFGYNGGGVILTTTNSAAGIGSLAFFKDPSDSFSGGQVGWRPTPAGLLSTLAGSFSVSLWIKTTNHTGTAGATASDGVCIVVADIPGDARDVTPLALNGGAVAFGTGGTSGDDTLTSTRLVSDNNWHHVVVTRDQVTGQKRIFIDGVADATGAGTTELLNQPIALSIGTRVDASHSDPLTSPFAGSYDGMIDDLQIYTRPLSGDEVNFLYTHPGKEVVNPGQNIPFDVQIRLEIRRNQSDTGTGQDYVVYPFILSSTPPLANGHHEVFSPHHAFFTRTDTDSTSSDGLSDSADFDTLAGAINECTNGLWWLILNSGDPSEQDLRFSVSISGLDTNVLGPVVVYTPTNGSANVSLQPAYQWSGLTNFESLNVVVDRPSLLKSTAFLPLTATNWDPGVALEYGTNQFFVNYISNNVPLITFTTPMDTNTLVSLSNWVATATIMSSAGSTFVVGAPAPLAVHLGSFHLTGTNFQFAFPSLAGRPHILQGSTNLVNWVDITNFIGDGSQQQFLMARTNGLRFFRVVTQ